MADRPLLFGVPVDPLTMDQTVSRCAELIESGVATQHVVLNAGKVVLMHDDPALARTIASSPLVNADGQSIVWAGRLLGVPFPERVTGIDLMERLLHLAEERSWPVYFLGARQEVLDAFTAVVRERYPRIVISGTHHGYLEDDVAAAEAVRSAGTRILMVAMPSPRKEQFIGEQLARLGPVFAMGVGGSFDVWSGLYRRAPEWMQRSGLEWFYRFIQDPRRMWKRVLLGNARFLALLVRERFRPSQLAS